MDATETAIGVSSYPWRIEFTTRKMRVYKGSHTVVEIPSKNLKDASLEVVLSRLEEILKDYFGIKACFQVADIETKFTEWKQCLK